jgi:NAD+ diphosphatase
LIADRPARDPWAVPGVPILARSGHDRIAHRRTDRNWVAAAWNDPASRVLLVSDNGFVPIRTEPEGPVLRYVEPPVAELVAPDGIRVLLGEAVGVVYFAVLANAALADAGLADAGLADAGLADAEVTHGALAGSDWRGLRELAAELTDLDVGLLTTAVALQSWHQRHQHCPRCGALTVVSKAGWTRHCPVDASEHFPRTDPAVIMLVHDGAGRCVLARGPNWPPGRMSVLAGFVEAGESAEAAVAREVREEVGISIRDVRYVASQPHPFPASLMLGYTALVDGDPSLIIDADEIVEAGWYSRDEVRRTTDWGAEQQPDELAGLDGSRAELRGLPGAMSIARQLINSWLSETE